MKTIQMLLIVCAASPFALAEEVKQVTLGDAKQPVLRYQAAYVSSPKADAPWYGRSGFIHPVYTPKGRVVTDGFPSDHLHQHGLMFAWTSARIDGRKVDFWNSAKKQGRIEHVATTSANANANEMVVKLRHVDLTGDKPTLVITETWRITRVTLDRAKDRYHVFDLESTQTVVHKRPITIAKYHYGGMCVRGSGQWIKGEFSMLTDEGKSQANGNHTRPNWVAMYGKVDGETCGIAAIAHPNNLHGPQPVRLHPKMPYFCYAPMVAGEFKLKPGKPYISRFRFVTFDGKPNAEALTKLCKDFAVTEKRVGKSFN